MVLCVPFAFGVFEIWLETSWFRVQILLRSNDLMPLDFFLLMFPPKQLIEVVNLTNADFTELEVNKQQWNVEILWHHLVNDKVWVYLQGELVVDSGTVKAMHRFDDQFGQWGGVTNLLLLETRNHQSNTNSGWLMTLSPTSLTTAQIISVPQIASVFMSPWAVGMDRGAIGSIMASLNT